ncbi:hypothetical protein HOLleu_38766 [Holothuria leucospilota]|uniref:Uncharacterized protein n=1 Tax=Holothuria leucospilota TaxID=206669 RepID=A0A9Q1BDL3_HOLLE|nr:hypothetical protein HOLleu_38766 [Holothuria leucospilota]
MQSYITNWLVLFVSYQKQVLVSSSYFQLLLREIVLQFRGIYLDHRLPTLSSHNARLYYALFNLVHCFKFDTHGKKSLWSKLDFSVLHITV